MTAISFFFGGVAVVCLLVFVAMLIALGPDE